MPRERPPAAPPSANQDLINLRTAFAKGGFKLVPAATASSILRARIEGAGGNVSAAARGLGLSFKTVSRWIDRLRDLNLDPRPRAPARA